MANRSELLVLAARAAAQRQPLDAAVLYERAGDLERAIALYTRGGVPTRAAQLLESTGRAPQAAALLTSLGRHLDAAAVHERTRDYGRAAAALLRGGERERAAAMFERAEAWSDAAKLYASMGNHEHAAQLLEGAGEADRAAALRAAAAPIPGEELGPDAPVEMIPGGVMDTGKLVAAVVALLGAGRVDDASRLYASSNEDVGYSILAAVAGRGPHQQAAARMFEAARDFAKAGECLEGLEDYAGAGAFYERADDAFMAAEMYLRAGDQARAALMLERSGNPGRAAELFEAVGGFDRAAACHEKAGHLLAAGQLYARLGNPGKALRLLQRVPREDPGWLRASRAVGELLASHGQPGVAIGRYDEALEGAVLTEQTAPLFSHLATCLEQTGDVARAASVLRQLAAWRVDFEDAGVRLAALQGRPAVSVPSPAPTAADRQAPGPVATRMEGLELLQRVEIFRALSLAQLRDLHAICALRSFRAGELLAEAAEPVQAIYLVRRGTVRLVVPTAQGNQIAGSAGPGTLLGLVNVFGDAPSPARLVADGEVDVLAISAARFAALLAADDQVALRVYRNVSRTLAMWVLAAGGMVARAGGAG
jgi:tetratricopeptide (TPR) repeat protein